jgi:virginiamycin B lyase
LRLRAWINIVLLVVLIGYGFVADADVSPDLAFLHPPDTSAAPTGLPTAATIDRPWGITAGHDGALWFTELDGNRIGRITVGGVIQEFPIPTPRSGPVGIVWGPDNAVWFTEAYADQIGRLDPATGHITEYASPQLGIQPGVLAVGGDGALYFTQNGYGNIGRFTPSTGRFDRFGLSPGRTLGLVRGPDGAIWFTSSWGGALQIGRLSPDGGILYYHDQGQFGSAASDTITVGPDGALWFTQTGSSAIGRLTTAGSFSRFPVAGGPAQALVTGPDGNLWYGRPDDGFGVVSMTGWSRAFYLGDQVLQSPIENIAVGRISIRYCSAPQPEILSGSLSPRHHRSPMAFPRHPTVRPGLPCRRAIGSVMWTAPAISDSFVPLALTASRQGSSPRRTAPPGSPSSGPGEWPISARSA